MQYFVFVFVTFVYGNARSSYQTAGIGFIMLLQVKERCFAGILCPVSKLLLDTKKLIILGNTVAAAGGTAFDLSSVEGNG